MRFLIPFCIILLGCNSPSPGFMGKPMSEVVIEGSTFRVWQNGTKAQAIRTNTQWAPSSMAIRPRFIEAIEQATGCKVTSAKGDAAIVTASLDCD